MRFLRRDPASVNARATPHPRGRGWGSRRTSLEAGERQKATGGASASGFLPVEGAGGRSARVFRRPRRRSQQKPTTVPLKMGLGLLFR
jgi:hypothetical protein